MNSQEWDEELRCQGREGELEEAAMVSWAIWRARNDFVWQQKSWTAANVVTSVRMLLDQFKDAQKRKGLSLSSLFDGGHLVEHWSALSSGKIKVNVDGALFEHEGRFGWGCVARDCHGNVVEAFNRGHLGRVQP
ncbi:uncharacterized protein LOC115700178 [Cannabis sativa]|uniref:uncharacterized protein LOC115700178 n=1 Tax=Cannabis sativa TaxID=3483 RepID=UPI0011E00FB4|nr:uncharacterized protein LOC115700178 [Cannabis sativa]